VVPPIATRLVTERLVVRPPKTTDVADLRRVLRENHEHLKPWNPAPRPGDDPTSITAVSGTIIRHRREWKAGTSFVFFATLRDSPDTILAKVALNGVLRGAMHGAYLGYWIDGAHQGKGLATEAIRAVLDFAFGPAMLHRVQAAIMPHNERSLRVAENLGLRREGYAIRYLHIAGKWEDHILFAVTSEEWPAPPSRPLQV
jgi:[ribosomal protein S5]-alanine N-acetyltransferase